MLSCFNAMTAHKFSPEILQNVFALRFQELSEKENWAHLRVANTPQKGRGIEVDEYDHMFTYYIVKQNEEGKVIGTGRLNPTTIPYMLSKEFNYLSNNSPIHAPDICEGSRIVVDRNLLKNRNDRRSVVNEILVGYYECAQYMNAIAMLAFMRPEIWQGTFTKIGWEPEWLGDPYMLMPSEEIVRAGKLHLHPDTEKAIRDYTGFLDPVLDFKGAAYTGAPQLTSPVDGKPVSTLEYLQQSKEEPPPIRVGEHVMNGSIEAKNIAAQARGERIIWTP